MARKMLRLPNAGGMDAAYKARLEALLLSPDPTFRRFCFEMMVDARIFMPTYSSGSTHGTAYYEGRRSLGLEVLHKLKHVRADVIAIIDAEGELLRVEQSPQQQRTPEQELDDDELPEP